MTDECDVYDHDWQIADFGHLKCNICNARTHVEGVLEE